MADDVQGIFADLVHGLDKCTTALNNAANSFSGNKSGFTGKAFKSTGSSRSLDATLRDAEKMFDRSSKNAKQALTMEQKIGNTFITSLQAVGRVFIKEFKDSISRVSNDYLANLTNITARMQLSNQEYASLYNEYASNISKDFKGAFSVKDFSSSLVSALDMGLRGNQAKDIAYRNMITNKLVPAISTNTQAYRRMSTTLGDAFNKNITAMAKYAESINAATGIEEGKLNASIEEFENEFLYEASKRGMTRDQASEVFAKFQLNLAQMTSQIGEDATQGYIDMLKGNMNNLIGSSGVQGWIQGRGTPEEAAAAMFDASGIETYLTDLAKLSKENADTLSVYGNVLGYNERAIRAVGTYINFADNPAAAIPDLISEIKSSRDEISSGTLKTIYDSETTKLEQGYYTSADDYFSNQIDNATTFISTWKSNIARFDTKLALLVGLVGTIAKNFIFTKTKGSSLFGNMGDITGGQSGLFGKFASKGYKNAPAEGVTSLSGKDTFAKGLTGSSTATASGLGVGLGSLLVGGVMMAKDAISVGTTNKSLTAGLTALYTGDSNRGLSEEEKIKKAQSENGWVAGGIDWKKVGKNSLKGAALGTGIGTAVGGWALGSGTAIGLGAGAVLGATASVVQQLADAAYYQDLAKKSKAYTESLDKLNKASKNYEETKQQEVSITKILNKEQKDNKDLINLKNAYPDLLANVKDVSELDSSYIKILKAKVELERKQAADEVSDKLNSNLKDAKKLFNKKTKKSVGDIGQAEYKAFELMNKQGSVTEEDIGAIAKQYSMAPETLKKELLNSGYAVSQGGKVVLYNKDSSFDAVTKDYDKANKPENIVKATEDINKALSDIQSQSNQLSSLWEYNKNSDSWSYAGSDPADFTKNWKAYNKFASDIKTKINNTTGDANEALLKTWNRIRPTLFGVDTTITPDDYRTPSFKVGTRNLSSDGLIYGHSGEMILTSANADKLRSIESSGGISGILSGLSNLTKTTASPVDNSTTIDPITNAVTEQTKTLSSILNQILNAVISIDPDKRKSVNTPVSVATDLINYEGA